LKKINGSKMKSAGLLALAVAVGLCLLFSSSEKSQEAYRGPEFDLRVLTPEELATLSSNGLDGDCIAAYKVARYHMFYSLDVAQATTFFRLASKCPNANAHASLISLLISKPECDAEVDKLLADLRKLDPQMAEGTAVEISLRRQARNQH
jgi:hypothetical protein